MLGAREPGIAVVVAPDAIERLAAHADAERWRKALVVMDPNTQEAAGARVVRELGAARIEAEELVFAERSGLTASDHAVARVRPLLGEGIHVRAPTAVFADPRVAAAAPPELTRSGIGDLLGKVTARVDWLAAHLLYAEPFCQPASERVLEPLSFAASNAPALMAAEPDAIRGLLLGLVQSGIAMAIAGSSRPASGCEHHASHFWDLLAARGRRPHAPHGLQVGYATWFAMGLQRFAFAGGITELRRPVITEEPLGPDARRWLGEPSVEVVAAVTVIDFLEGQGALDAALAAILE